MTDYSQLSNDALMAIVNGSQTQSAPAAPPQANPYSAMSNDDLMKIINGESAKAAPAAPPPQPQMQSVPGHSESMGAKPPSINPDYLPQDFTAVTDMGGSPTSVGSQLMAKGIPIAGNFAPQSDETKQFEINHPGIAAGLKAAGGATSVAPLTFAAPGLMGMSGGPITRSIMGYLSSGGLQGGDQYVKNRQAGQDIPTALGNAAEVGNRAGAFGAILSGLGAGVAPSVTDSARYLYDKGVKMTAGQTGGGLAKWLEDTAESVPIAGQGVKEARLNSIDSFNRGMLNEGLSHLPGSPKLPAHVDAGYEGRQYLGNTIQQEYRDAYRGTKIVQKTSTPNRPNLQDRANNIVTDARVSGTVTDESVDRLQRILDSQIANRFKQGPRGGKTITMSAEAMDTADSQLREMSSRLQNSPLAEEQNLGGYVSQLRDELQTEFAAQNPIAAARIKAADKAWRDYSVIRQAGSGTAVKGEEGLVTPKQLQAASRMGDRSYAHRATSEGRGTLQEYANAGSNTLPSELPNSGTSDRTATGALGLLTALHPALGVPLIAGGTLAKNIIASPKFQGFMRNAIAAAPATRGAISSITTPGIPMSVQGVMQGLKFDDYKHLGQKQ